MNPNKLERLRSRYQNAKGGDIYDPAFRRVADAVFTSPDRRKWPFADPATLLSAPFRPLILPGAARSDLDVALVGVPMDLGVTNRAGARLGPRAVRSVDRIGPYEHVLRVAPAGLLSFADVGDVPMRSQFSLAECHQDIEAYFSTVRDAGAIPLAVGGDHSISGPILAALGRDRPVGMVHIDAHCDTAGEYEGSKFHHGGPFRQAVLAGVLDPERTIQIGIRGGAEYLWEFSFESGMTVLHAEEVQSLGIDAVIGKARSVVAGGPTYVSFDIDSLDPAFAPGTGTPEVGGLSPREVLQILRGLAGVNIVGGDVVEVAPQYDANTTTAQIGAQMLFQLLCLVALRAQSAKMAPRAGPDVISKAKSRLHASSLARARSFSYPKCSRIVILALVACCRMGEDASFCCLPRIAFLPARLRGLHGKGDRQMRTTVIDDLGRHWSPRDPWFLQSAGITRTSPELLDYLVKNRGFAVVGVVDRSILVRIRPVAVTQMALAETFTWTMSQQADRAMITYFHEPDEEWRHLIVGSRGEITQRLVDLVNDVQARPSRRFRRKMLVIDHLPRDHAAVPIVSKWRELRGIGNPEELFPLFENGFKHKHMLLLVHNDGARLIMDRVASGYTVLNPKVAVGNRVEDQPDYEYGRWVAEAYRQTYREQVPRLEQVEATLHRPRRHARYEQLILPLATPDRQPLLMSGTLLN